MSERSNRRFPQQLFGVGTEPDPRFSLANERTFLAWIRTSLALSALGVALEALIPGLQHGLQLSASLILIAAGIGAAVQSWIAWYNTEKALRLTRPLPANVLSAPIAVAVAVAGLLVGAAVIIG
jgi:putative membrane protein